MTALDRAEPEPLPALLRYEAARARGLLAGGRVAAGSGSAAGSDAPSASSRAAVSAALDALEARRLGRVHAAAAPVHALASRCAAFAR